MTVTELPRVAPETMSPDIRAVRDQLDALTGDARFVEVFAHAPELLDFVMRAFYGEIFFAGRVDQRYKQLMRLHLSLRHGCRTCNKQNVPGAREAGLSDAQVSALIDGRMDAFSDPDRAVLEYAELMTIANDTQAMPDALKARLLRHFDVAEICELGVVGAVISGMAKLSFVLDVVEKEDYCRFA